MVRRAAVLLATLAWTLSTSGLVSAADAQGPLALTKSVLGRSNEIVRSDAEKKEKLAELGTLLRGFLDTDALADRAAHKHLVGRSPEETAEFRGLFHDFFVRTYVQRLLLFDGPDFTYGAETITGDDAKVGTEVVTTNDRFNVDYTLRREADGWRTTDIVVEGVSLAENFRAQFDAAVAKDSFQGLLDRLRAKAATPAS
jgi:phospholipid transport system substrate-binding protein